MTMYSYIYINHKIYDMKPFQMSNNYTYICTLKLTGYIVTCLILLSEQAWLIEARTQR